MSTGKRIAAGGIVVVVLGGLVAANLLAKGKKGLPVTYHAVKLEDITARVSCTGKVSAKRKVEVSANVMGQIVNLAVREGDRVEKDQFLLQIDRTQLRAQATGSEAALQALLADRDAARATAHQARSDHERAEKNFHDHIISEAESQRARMTLDSAQATLASTEQRIAQARASLEASRDNLSKTTIKSPIAGVVTALPVEEGEVAVIGTMNNAGTKLMTVSDMSVVEAEMQVDETDVPRVRLEQKATLKLDAFPDQSFEGAVSEIGSSPLTKTGTDQAVEFSVKVVFRQPPEGVRPGFSVSADIETGERKGAVAIPVQALVIQDEGDKKKDGGAASGPTGAEGKKGAARTKGIEGVYRIDAGKARFVPVKTGLQGDLLIEVTDGVKAGDQIVAGPFRVLRTLKDGDQVRPEEQKKDKGASPTPAGKSGA